MDSTGKNAGDAAAGNNTAANGGTVNVALASAAREYHNFLSDVEDLVASSTSLSSEDLARAKARLSARVAAAKASVARIGGAVVEQGRSSAAAADHFVRARPWQSLLASAGVGLLLGLVLARRRD